MMLAGLWEEIGRKRGCSINNIDTGLNGKNSAIYCKYKDIICRENSTKNYIIIMWEES